MSKPFSTVTKRWLDLARSPRLARAGSKPRSTATRRPLPMSFATLWRTPRPCLTFTSLSGTWAVASSLSPAGAGASPHVRPVQRRRQWSRASSLRLTSSGRQLKASSRAPLTRPCARYGRVRPMPMCTRPGGRKARSEGRSAAAATTTIRARAQRRGPWAPPRIPREKPRSGGAFLSLEGVARSCAITPLLLALSADVYSFVSSSIGRPCTRGMRARIFEIVWIFTSPAHCESTVPFVSVDWLGSSNPLRSIAVRDVDELAVAHEAGGDRESSRPPPSVDPAEVAQLRHHATGWVENDDLVGLVRRHPEVVVLVDDQAIGAVDAVHEYRRGSEAYLKMARSTVWARGTRWRSGAKSFIKPVT